MKRLYIEYLGNSVELPRGETVVGREVGCTLRFNDPLVSRRHLRLVRRVDEAFVEDLGSSNGTLLNGRVVKAPLRLRDGDEITVGSRTLTVRVVDEAEPVGNTLLLGDMLEQELDDIPPPPSSRKTHQIPRVPEPPSANQRCPSCATPVRDSDERCAACGHTWGARPMSPTLPPGGLGSPLDRRRHERVPIELRLVYVSSALEIEATSIDLSRSGVFVRTQILEPAGTECQLTMLIDGGPPLKVSGIVRRVVEHNDRGEPVGLGVELLGLGEHERAWIDVAIDRMAS